MGLLGKLFRSDKKSNAKETHALTYRVGINETCRSLAKRFYGDESQWERTYSANERLIRDEVQTSTAVLLPGTEIVVPEPTFGLDGRSYAPAPAGAA